MQPLPDSTPGAPTQEADSANQSLPFVTLPSSSTIPIINHTSPLTPVTCDERVMSRLLELMLNRGGLSIAEAAKRLGFSANNISQYINGRRSHPSLLWFVRFADICGAKVTIEFPK